MMSMSGKSGKIGIVILIVVIALVLGIFIAVLAGYNKAIRLDEQAEYFKAIEEQKAPTKVKF